MKNQNCPHCAGLGKILRCRMGDQCICAVVDSGVACSQGMSYKCMHCNPTFSGTQWKEISRDETANIL